MKRLCDSEKEAGRLLECLASAQGPVGFDTEASGPQLLGQDMINVYSSTLTGFSVSLDHISWYVPVAHRKGENLGYGLVLKILFAIARSGLTVWAHNWKFDLQMLYNVSQELGNAFEDADLRDSMIAAWLMQYEVYGLKDLAKAILGETPETFEDVARGRSFDQLTPREALSYACDDAIWTVKIGIYFEDRIKAFSKRLYQTFLELEMPFVRVLRHMESSGMSLDVQELERQRDLLRPLQRRLYDDWFFLTGGVNPNSGPQVSRWAYGTREEYKKGKTIHFRFRDGHWPADDIDLSKDNWPLTNADAVTTALNRCAPGTVGHEAARLKLEYAAANKVLSTYTDSLLQNAAQYMDGRLHSSYWHTGTATGRLSSSDPNLQNIPVRTEAGRAIRKAFVARPGFTFISDDYSQIELRMLAHLAGPGKLLNAYLTGIDVHKQTGDLAGGTRDQGKTGNFAVVYGAMGKKLAKTLGMTKPQADSFIEAFFREYSEVSELKESVIELSRERGYVRTIAGRFRRLPGLTSHDRMDRWAAERRAFNTPIQGGARDLMTKAMVDIYQALRKNGDLSRAMLVFQVHDDLGLEAAHGFERDVEALVKDKMENVWPGFRCPLVAEAVSGPTWYSLKG